MFAATAKKLYTPVTSACLALNLKSSQGLVDQPEEGNGTKSLKWIHNLVGSEALTGNHRVIATSSPLYTLCCKDSLADKLLAGDTKMNMQPVLDSLVDNITSASVIDKTISQMG